MIITIDGPCGSGKSTAAQNVARVLDIFYLNTGMLYRALAHLIFFDDRSKYFHKSISECSDLTMQFLESLPHIVYSYENGEAKIFIEGVDVTRHLFGDVAQYASQISSIPVIRDFLLDVQRDVAKNNSVISDGRDCGSVIFPAAEFKFYLYATLDVRACRRMTDPKVQTKHMTFEQVCQDLTIRDERDKNRAISPLKIPVGAISIDSSAMSIDQVVEKMLAYVRGSA